MGHLGLGSLLPLTTVDKLEIHPAGLAVERDLAASVGKPEAIGRRCFGLHSVVAPAETCWWKG